MSDAFDPVAAARVIGEMTAYVKALPPQARQMGDAIVGLCDVMLDARTRDAARIADLTRQLAEAREVKPEHAETLAKEMQAIVAADRWKGRDLSAAPPEKWSHLRPETQKFWISTAARILSALKGPTP